MEHQFTVEPNRPLEAEFDPDDPEHVVAPSLREAFKWLLSTDSFVNDNGEIELLDDESRSRVDEIGSIYSYAIVEGVSEEMIDRMYAEALEEIKQADES